jgi:hypothetical protein
LQTIFVSKDAQIPPHCSKFEGSDEAQATGDLIHTVLAEIPSVPTDFQHSFFFFFFFFFLSFS